ncbi:MAG: UbiD family decarboxylase [Pseudomonadota bacterium]
MAAIKTMRNFLRRLEQRGDLVRVKRKVSPLFEQTTILKKVMDASGKTVLFENVGYGNFKIVGNIYGGRNKFATLFDVPELEIRPHFEKLLRRKPISPRIIKHAPVQEVVHLGKPNIPNLLPVPFQYEKDRSRYITAGLIVARDPDTGINNVSFARLMVHGVNILGIQIVPRMDLDSIYQHAQARNQPLEVAAVIGGNPWFFLAASTHIPLNVDEYDFAGGLRGEALNLISCKTVNLAVPSDAEIIIEGQIPPGVLRPEGPMGEVHGYYGTEFPKPIIEVSAITHRRDPIFHTILSGTIEEHAPLALPIEATILKAMRRIHKGVRDINLMPSLYRCVASVRNLPDDGIAEKLLRAMLGHPWVFLAILVNDDIDIHNHQDVLWAITTRTNPEADIFIEQFPTDTKTDDRGIPPTPVKRPLNGQRYRTGINAAIERRTTKNFVRSRAKDYHLLNLKRYLAGA